MSDAAPTRLRVDNAVVSFDSLHVLGPLSFEVKAGHCVVLLGPSGCGKSTLLAAAAGLQSLTSGSIWSGDHSKPPGFVFQDPNLMGWASALDNVALPLALSRTSRGEQQSRARTALQLVGLGEFEKARPRALSGGMAMRVALARALVSEPEVLLLDEPFGAIDEIGRRGLNDLVHAAKQSRHIGIVFVTHSVEEAAYMADTILVLSPRPGHITATIEVPDTKRDTAFLMSDAFADIVTRARRALAMGQTS